MAWKRRTAAQVALAKEVKNNQYKKRVKALRATNAFGDMFKAGVSGADLRRSPDDWPSVIKARITKYAKELGPLIAGETKTKRYFRPDHLASAIEVSPQENRLPGQKAALFPVDDREERVKISFDRKHRIKVIRGGVEEIKMNFDMNEFILDPVAEVERVLDQAPGHFFKFVTGANESKDTYTRETMLDQLERMIVRYLGTDKDVEDFLYGIKAYPELKSQKILTKRAIKHQEQVTKRQRARWVVRSKQVRAMSHAEMKSIRTTGRKGRVK